VRSEIISVEVESARLIETELQETVKKLNTAKKP
jgi:hypothetical protein